MMKWIFGMICLLGGYHDIIAQPLSGNLLWLKADYGIKDSAGKVVTWTDARNPGLVASSPTEVNRPFLVKNSINGLPVVRGSGYAQYMNAPSVFPVQRDYSLCYVVQLNNFASANNTIGGNGHTMYYNPLIVNHGNFYYSSYSYLPFILYHPHIVTVIYNQAKQTVRQYLDGELMDSAYIGSNFDPTIQLGAYQGSNYLIGDFAEFMLYDHEFTQGEKDSVEKYLFAKYQIELPLASLKPSPVFTEIPQDLQLYPRGTNDSAIVRIAGKVPTGAFDSVIVIIKKNNQFLRALSQRLTSVGAEASFELTPSIHAELSEYSFDIYGRKSGVDTLLARRRDVVCGDVYLIAGQSNAIQGRMESVYRNEFCRTFGMNASMKPADTQWAISTGITNAGGTNVGAWGLRIQQLLMQTTNIPICMINAGEISTNIEKHLPNTSYPTDIYTVYGRLLYRVQKARLDKAVRALIFYQGESDIDYLYFQRFATLYQRWNIDYPALRHVYVAQIHPGCTAGSSQAMLREVQRTLPDFFPKVKVLSMAALTGHLDCHFTYEGYQVLGEQFFRFIARDFYGWKDTFAIESPAIRTARFTDTTKSTLALVFSPKGTRMFVEQSYPFKHVTGHITDAFSTDSRDSVVAVSSIGDTVFVHFAAKSTATTISYLESNYYPGTQIPYEGPWLTNQRSMGALTFYAFPITKTSSSGSGVPYSVDSARQSFTVYPNPARQGIVVEFMMAIQGSAVLEMYDVMGSKIKELYGDSDLSAGEHRLTLELPDIAAGNYILELRTPTGKATHKLSVQQ
jgi:hypothetical protein